MKQRDAIERRNAGQSAGPTAERQCRTEHKYAERDLHLASLMRSAQEGDGVAYESLLRQLTPTLRNIVRRRGPMIDRSQVEDIVQEILISLHSARATYDPDRPFLPWLASIARNRTADAMRREMRRSAHEVIVDALPETFSTDGANMSDGTFRDPEALHRAIKSLPPVQRRALELLKIRELTLKEASVVSGASIGALKVAVHRAIATLRITLSNEV